MRKQYKIVKPFRFFVFVLAVVLTMSFAGLSIIHAGNASAASVSAYKQVEIQTNDTLWNIAEEYCSDNMDIRSYIDDICEINDISPSNVQSGDLIFVPIYNL